VRNFNQLNFSISDIDAIILTHAHTDHTADLETILNLNYELNQVQPGHNIDLFMNLGTLNKFIGWVSKLGGIGNIISLNVGETIEPQGYGWKLNVKSCLHSEIIGKNCIGLVFDLISASCVQLKLGLTSDTGWSKLVQEQYNGCRLLCVHLGSIGENEFNEAISIRSPKRLYQNQQHLGLIGVTRIFNYIKPEVCIISEFGEELGEDRCIVSKTLDLRFRNDSRCFTGDIGLKVRLPDLSIFCPICSNYVDYKIVKEMHLPQGQQVVNYCSTHTDNEKAAYIQGLPL